MSNRAWVTLATNDSYGVGALVLAHSLRQVGSAYPAVVLITPSVTEVMRDRLSAVFAEVITVDVLDSQDAVHLALLQRPELGITFTKIHCWNLTQYEKCVFLDADVLVVQKCDELFEREELSAAPDVGWPDCFNTGVFVFCPSADTFSNLIKFAQERGSFDGGDQGLLNSFFSDWARGDSNKRLPFLYNVTSAAFYSYLPALKQYGQDLKIIHFIGAGKPWLQNFNWESRTVEAPEHLRQFLQAWWDLFIAQVHPLLDVSMVELVEAPSGIPQQDSEYIMPDSEQRLNFSHYEPVLNPHSEFPWHHPDKQITNTENNESAIDMSQFHDPWDMYRGHIPPQAIDLNKTEPTVENLEEVRKYAWEYIAAPHHEYYSTENNTVQNTDDNFFHQTSPDTHNHDTSFYDNTQWQQHSVADHWHQATPSDHWQEFPSSAHWQHHSSSDHWAQPRSSEQWEQQSSSDNWHQHSFDHRQQYFSSDHYQHNPSSNNLQEYSLPVHSQQQSSLSYSHSYQQYSSQDQSDKNFPLEHLQNDTINKEQLFTYENDNIYNEHLKYIEHNTHEPVIPTHFSSEKEKFRVFSSMKPMQRNQELQKQHVYSVHLDHEKIRSKHRTEKINGYISDSESDISEEFRPRHPYDGFYLRHQVTIDSHGRKICIHEIPHLPPSRSPSPSPSPPPDSPEIFEDALEFLEPTKDEVNGDIHTGVAGNLSRIVPGAPIQREAVDELTRRQGWETGNMDYMGADSFANIWAKISQTLSQPPSTPPKQSSPQKDQPPAESKTDKPLESSETKIQQQTVAPVTSPIKQPTGKPDNESVLESASVEPSAKVEPVQTTVPPAVEEPIPIPVEAATVDAAPVPAQISQSTEDETESVATTELPVAAIEALKLGETVPNLPQTESVPVTETEPKVESVPTIASEPKIESVPIAEPKLKSVPITEPEPTVEPVPMAEPEPKLESKPIVTPEPKVESVPVVEPDAKVESEPKVESVPIVEATPTVQLETNVETQPKVESMTAVELSATKPAVESPIKESTIVPPASPPADKSLETESAVVSPTPASADKSPATEPADESFVSLPESEPAIELTTKESAETSPTLEPAVSTVPEPKDSDKTADISVSDSPPLANTPSKEDIPVAPVAKSSEEAAQETRL